MKIAVLLSGGVDSSVALALLKEKGYEITAFYIKIWLEDELSFLGECPWEEDLKYARGVCEKFGVPLKIISLQRDYYKRVVSYAIDELKAGRTPSPDIFCNKHIKFGTFFDKIDDSFDKVASGHYANIEQQGELFFLKTSPDLVKDQTYFLAHLTQKQISRILFPIGNLQKNQIRELAQKYDLPTKDRKDSQGICFLGKIKYRDFVKYHLGIKKGDIVQTPGNKKLGDHNGYWYYTIGQRQGLGLSGGPWYVVKKDIEKNIIYVSKKFDKTQYAQNTFFVGELNWICKPPEHENLRVKIRHGPKFYNCKFIWESQKAKVILAQTDSGIASGQFCVFYYKDTCLGCGKIFELHGLLTQNFAIQTV